ncbi:MAG: hypothetical protein AAGC55_29260, partial [Myxococcota bacterium]
GAAAGAAVPWVLIFPLANSEDSGSGPRQVTAALSAGGLLAGAYLAWRATRDMDGRRAADPQEDDEDIDEEDVDEGEKEGDDSRRIGRLGSAPPPPGLVQRHADGRWSLGVPLVRPAGDLRLAPRPGKPGLAVDVLSGHF